MLKCEDVYILQATVYLVSPTRSLIFLLTLKSILVFICILNQNITFSNKPSKHYKKNFKASAVTCPHEANVNNPDENISADTHNSYALSISGPRLQLP